MAMNAPRYAARAVALLLAGVSAAACSANPLDPDKKGCLEIRGIGNTCENATANEPSACQTACGNADQCVGLGRLGYDSVDACIAACKTGVIPAETTDCLANASNCAAATGCVTGGGDGAGCEGACNALDQCSAGGLAGQGITMNQCIVACGAGQLAAQSVIDCLAAAQDCNQANACAQ